MEKPIELQENEFAALLAYLPDDSGLVIELLPQGWDLSKVDSNYLFKLGNNPDLFHIDWLESRVGSMLFANHLECTHYPIDTPENDKLKLTYYKWRNLLWMIASIPLTDKEYACESAKHAKLRLIEGFPVAMGEPPIMVVATVTYKMEQSKTFEGMYVRFPLPGINVSHLENDHDSQDVTSRGGRQDALVEETYAVKQLMKEHNNGEN